VVASQKGILFKGLDERGFVFYTNYERRQVGIIQLVANPIGKKGL
jgi:pyridoxine/pyridoxamine 5'-phosphate oxidase